MPLLFSSAATYAQDLPGDSGGTWKWKGQSAEASFSDKDGGGIVSVFQNGSSTTLHYAIWGNDPSSEVCSFVTDQFGNTIEICVFTRSTYDYGWGTIPTADMQFDPQFARLLTTTGTAAFTNTTCTTDKMTAPPVTTCAPGSGGSFDVTWTANGHYTTSGNGVDQKNYGSFSFKTNGGYQGRSAYANGNALGHAFTNAPGELRATTGKSVTKTITAN